MAGKFGEKALDRVVASDTFVPATIRKIRYIERMKYYSGRSRTMHTGMASLVDSQSSHDARRLLPELCVELYVPNISESILVKMSAKEIVQFGEVSSLKGSFSLDESLTDVEVKVTTDSLTIRDVGSFDRVEEDKKDISTVGMATDYNFTEVESFSRVIRKQLRKAWFRANGGYEGLWRVSKVRERDYSPKAEIQVEHPEFERSLRFLVSMDDWDDDKSLRRLIKSDGSGLISNLEEEDVFVSLTEYGHTDPIAVDSDWKLYRKSEKPNFIRRFAEKRF